MLDAAEGEELGRCNVAVDPGWVLAVSDIVEARSQSPPLPEYSKPSLDVRVQQEDEWKSPRIRRPYDLLIAIEHAKGKPIPPLQ